MKLGRIIYLLLGISYWVGLLYVAITTYQYEHSFGIAFLAIFIYLFVSAIFNLVIIMISEKTEILPPLFFFTFDKKIKYKNDQIDNFYSSIGVDSNCEPTIDIYKQYWLTYSNVYSSNTSSVEESREKICSYLDIQIEELKQEEERMKKITEIEDSHKKWNGCVDKFSDREESINDLLKG